MTAAPTTLSASMSIKVQFYDCDPMQIVWHGNYPRFFEQARCALLDRIAFNYRQMSATDYVWPIVDMRIKYVRSLQFGQVIEATATLVEFENRLRIAYELRDTASGEIVTKGETIQVAVHRVTGATEFESPPALLDAVRRVLP
jgi:acyl-CoA thioester hydrolase